jgi:hypothetical protein
LLPLSEFYLAESKRGRPLIDCVKCCSLRQKERTSSLNTGLYKNKYGGLTQEQYAAMVRIRGGACDICGLVPERGRLNIDHDHKTGKIRGLLCRQHNLGLGFFRDEVVLLSAAIRYLEK